MQQKIIKTGHSLAITIPSEFVKIMGLRPGQNVHTRVDLIHARLTHAFNHAGQLSLLSKK